MSSSFLIFELFGLTSSVYVFLSPCLGIVTIDLILHGRAVGHGVQDRHDHHRFSERDGAPASRRLRECRHKAARGTILVIVECPQSLYMAS